jgi:hypothetical protein
VFCGASPSNFFRNATWKTLWILAFADSRNLYATGPIRSITSYGLKNFGASLVLALSRTEAVARWFKRSQTKSPGELNVAMPLVVCHLHSCMCLK